LAREYAQGVVKTGGYLGYGFDAVRMTYTGGDDELPADLNRALTVIVARRTDDPEPDGGVPAA
jgi:hypothetical protein